MRKLYGEFDRSDWLRVGHLDESQVPESIILHGEDENVLENIADWEATFEGVIVRPRWNMIVGNWKGKRIGFANVCWAPMTALVVHKFAMMGTKRFIQIGYCGGLSRNLNYGEILVVKNAVGEDGISSEYILEGSELSS
ncbi:MAG: hypothetical protein KDD25_04570, partial [Bdellovibrionales bacterium]|nr:hypothetical protein [Bdellovibrionales bacterium]